MINLTDIRETTAATIEANRIEAEEREAYICNNICVFMGTVEETLLPEYSCFIDNIVTSVARSRKYKTFVRSLRSYKHSEFEKYLLDASILIDKKLIDFFESQVEDLEDHFFQKYRDEGFVVDKIPGDDPFERRYRISWEVKEEPNESL